MGMLRMGGEPRPGWGRPSDSQAQPTPVSGRVGGCPHEQSAEAEPRRSLMKVGRNVRRAAGTRRAGRGLGALVGGGLASAMAAGPPAGATGGVEVGQGGDRFTPPAVTVNQGDTVNWHWASS